MVDFFGVVIITLMIGFTIGTIAGIFIASPFPIAGCKNITSTEQAGKCYELMKKQEGCK